MHGDTNDSGESKREGREEGKESHKLGFAFGLLDLSESLSAKRCMLSLRVFLAEC